MTVHEDLAHFVPADVVDKQKLGFEPALDGAVAEVFGVGQVFERFTDAGEMEFARVEVRLKVAPVSDQFFMDAVELVFIFIEVAEPEPLDDARFEEAGRRVGVEFEKFDLAVLKTEIETPVDGGVVVFPGPFDVGDEFFWDSKFIVELFVDHMLHGAEAKFP